MWMGTQIFTRKEMSEMNDMFQVDYLPDEKKILDAKTEGMWVTVNDLPVMRKGRVVPRYPR